LRLRGRKKGWKPLKYRAFHRFGNDKFPNGGSVLGLIEPIITTAAAASKNDTRFKSGQNRLENYHLALFI